MFHIEPIKSITIEFRMGFSSFRMKNLMESAFGQFHTIEKYDKVLIHIF